MRISSGGDQAGARLHAATDSRQMSETAKIRVLIAEDDDNARSLLVELLATLGHTVVSEVATGREAYESAKDAAPDVVLPAVHWRDGSGFEAPGRLRQNIPGV